MKPQVKTALITGSNGGLGLSLVEAYLNAGYFVIGTDLNTYSSISEISYYLPMDLSRLATDPAYAKQQVAQIKKNLPSEKLNALINNAAVQLIDNTPDIAFSDWNLSLAVNLTAPFLLSQAFLEQLAICKGSILNISSIHANLTKPGFVSYATTKGALSSLTRALAVDLGARVRVNAIEPAAVETEMLRDGLTKAELERLADFHPVGRIGTVHEIADLALYLTSDSAQFIHGAIVSVSGGINGRLADPKI